MNFTVVELVIVIIGLERLNIWYCLIKIII